MLTPTHLAIVMEYAAGGELFDRICSAGRFSEDEVIIRLLEFRRLGRISSAFFSPKPFGLDVIIPFLFLQARYFFQQLICGVSYCHFMVRTAAK